MTSAATTTNDAAPFSPSRRADWDGIWEDAPEFDGPVAEVEGKVPAGLVGSLLRNGPGRRSYSQHYFDGDGMIRRLQFGADGSVRYTNRFVHTPRYLAESEAGRALFRGAGTQLPGGMLGNLLRMPKTYANTTAYHHAGKLLALYEGGPAYAIDGQSLQTLGVEDYDGALSPTMPVSAHPHTDPTTGEMFNFGLVADPRSPHLRTFKVSSSGKVTMLSKTPVPHYTFLHDFALTEQWMVFSIPPVRTNLPRMMLGASSVMGAMQSVEGMAAQHILVSRDGQRTLRFETEACVVGHVIGAREVGAEVVLDIVSIKDWAGGARDMVEHRTSEFPSFATIQMWRYRFNTDTGRSQGEALLDHPGDFPRSDERLPMHAWRYSYLSLNPEPRSTGLVRRHSKLDLQTGKVVSYDHGPGHVAHEAVFAPDPDRDAEDGGWLLSFVYNARRRATDAVVLDAQHIEDGPVATVRLPVSAGTTFHGCWVGR